MAYVLKHFDTPLLGFTVEADLSALTVRIDWIDEENRTRLPLDLVPTDSGLGTWLRHRTIPKNRAYVHALLAKCGLHPNRPMGIIEVCRGLSLTDCYWVVDEAFTGSFERYNLYDNRFDRILSLLAFTGFGSSPRASLLSSPEFTTNGMLPKCWRHVDGKTVLYKGGTSGASNAGFEPYSEYYAAQVAEAMGVCAVSYGLKQWKGQLCSTCALFTSKAFSFVPVGRLVREGGFDAVRAYYDGLGAKYTEALQDMLVFDAVICNTDRHFGNFGFLVDNATNTIAAPAPLFDHGNALFNFAGREFLKNGDTLRKYGATLRPRTYADFFVEARKGMTPRSREQLRRLMNFEFTRHPRYNLPKDALKCIEGQVRERARALLGKL